MLDRTIVLGTIAACMLMTPVAAQAPAQTTAFDGTYVGVSMTLEGTMGGGVGGDRGAGGHGNCPLNGQPGRLTITGGVPQYNGSNLHPDTYEGSVNAQGVLVLRAPHGTRIDAQIDGRGTVTGRGSGGCSYHVVWQKQGK